MTPVDATKTALPGIESTSPALSAMRLQYSIPSSPVQALATPLLATTACTKGLVSQISLSQFTGAAFTTFVVNVPAAWHGTSLYTIAISLTFAFFTPAAIPAALNPFGAVTPPSITVILICFFAV